MTMNNIISGGYNITIEQNRNVEKILKRDRLNWNLFSVGDNVYLEDEYGEYQYTVDYINHDMNLIVLI